MKRRVKLDGLELDCEIRGTGEPVVLVHAGLFADWFTPLVDQAALRPYQVVSFHRAGYAGSSRVEGPLSIAQQAAYVRALMMHLGVVRGHVVGHSDGGNIALQLALDAPQLVHTLALLEPALPVAPGGAERLLATRASAMAAVMERFRAGDKAAAVDGFMRIVAGPTYRAAFDRALPGVFDRGVADADTFFTQNLPAVQQWAFTREDASRITQPALAVIGEKSKDVSPIWIERQNMLVTWLPMATPFVLADATHLLHVENPRGMAEALAGFFQRHPLPRPR
jgi:pimeloyl-ACP methyl ester carboxylesterase